MTKVAERPLLEQETPEAPYRQPPSNIQAEQALLGAVLTSPNNEAVNRMGDFLLAEHFYEPVHQRIYEAILSCMERGIVATPVTLKNYFDKDEGLTEVGGGEYLVRLATMATTIINVQTYAQTIYDLAIRRKLITIGEDVVNEAFDSELGKTANMQIEEAEQYLFNLASEGTAEGGFVPLKSAVLEALQQTERAFKRKEAVSGISTGFVDVDRLLGGLQPSDLIILAGRPSMGKTALAVNLAMNACFALQKAPREPGQPAPSVGFFSLEMSSSQLAGRMMAMMTGINSSKMRIGNMTDEEFARLVSGNRELHDMPFFIDDTPALSIAALRTRARRLKRKHNLSALFVDYLQLVRGVGKASEGNRVQEVSEITQGLKAIAKELNIPVMALSQLSRAVEQREDKRPQLSDLRESGSIEQDADIVVFIYREEYYVGRKQPPPGTPQHADWQEEMSKVMNLAEVIVAKQRHGPIGNVQLFFDSNTTGFKDLDRVY